MKGTIHGPGPWTWSTEVVHGPHVLYFPFLPGCLLHPVQYQFSIVLELYLLRVIECTLRVLNHLLQSRQFQAKKQ